MLLVVRRHVPENVAGLAPERLAQRVERAEADGSGKVRAFVFGAYFISHEYPNLSLFMLLTHLSQLKRQLMLLLQLTEHMFRNQ